MTTDDWPAREPAPDLEDETVRTGRPDLLAHYRDLLSRRFQRRLNNRETVDVCLLLVRAGERTQRGVCPSQATIDAVARRRGPRPSA